MPNLDHYNYTQYKMTETEQNNNLRKQSHVSGWKITGISALIILFYHMFMIIFA